MARRDRDVAGVGGVRRARGELGPDRVAGLRRSCRAPGRPASRPGRTRSASAGSSSRWSGSHWRVALLRRGRRRCSPGRTSRAGRRPRSSHLRYVAPGGGDHLGARVDTAHPRARPAVGEQPGEGAGAAAQVDDVGGLGGPDPGEQVEERAGRARRRRSGSGQGPSDRRCGPCVALYLDIKILDKGCTMWRVQDEVDELMRGVGARAPRPRPRARRGVQPDQPAGPPPRPGPPRRVQPPPDRVVGVRRAGGAAACGAAVRALAGAAAARDAGDQRDHDQPGRPAGRPRPGRPLPRPLRPARCASCG